MKVVIALGGNALLRRGQPMTEQTQRENVKTAVKALAEVAHEHTLVITHGNGPQVGLLALQAAAYTGVEPYPLDVLDAQSEGMIGYLIEQELGNVMPYEQAIATLLTQIEVDPNDPAFKKPSKPIGPIYTREEAERLARERVEYRARWGQLPPGGAVTLAEAHFRDPCDRVPATNGSDCDLRWRGRHSHGVSRGLEPGRR
jgi:carbamate kinase